MSKIKYKRDHPDGYIEIFEDIIKRPSEDQKYFDDVISNNSEEDVLPIVFSSFGKEKSYPLRTIRHSPKNKFILHYVTDGKGYFKGETIGKGQGFLIFPGTSYSMSADNDDPWHFYWTIFEGKEAYSILKSVNIDEENCIFKYGFEDKVSEIFEDLIYSSHNDADMDLYMYSKFYQLMSYHKKQCVDGYSGEKIKKGYVAQAVKLIDENYTSGITIEEIASELHISRKYLCRIFTSYMGASAKEYLLHRRLEEASVLLRETDLTVSEIAHSVGYGDYTQLTRLFKVKKGISPLQYRSRFR